jgi:hypothetical protein
MALGGIFGRRSRRSSGRRRRGARGHGGALTGLVSAAAKCAGAVLARVQSRPPGVARCPPPRRPVVARPVRDGTGAFSELSASRKRHVRWSPRQLPGGDHVSHHSRRAHRKVPPACPVDPGGDGYRSDCGNAGDRCVIRLGRLERVPGRGCGCREGVGRAGELRATARVPKPGIQPAGELRATAGLPEPPTRPVRPVARVRGSGAFAPGPRSMHPELSPTIRA